MNGMPMFVMSGSPDAPSGKPSGNCPGLCIDLESVKDLVGCMDAANHANGVTTEVMAALLDALDAAVASVRTELANPKPKAVTAEPTAVGGEDGAVYL